MGERIGEQRASGNIGHSTSMCLWRLALPARSMREHPNPVDRDEGFDASIPRGLGGLHCSRCGDGGPEAGVACRLG
jgi:hypothetical protein